jgi:CTP synthase
MRGSQFHPEFRSRPDRPQPLFREFIAAAKSRQAGRDAGLLSPERAHSPAVSQTVAAGGA